MRTPVSTGLMGFINRLQFKPKDTNNDLVFVKIKTNSQNVRKNRQSIIWKKRKRYQKYSLEIRVMYTYKIKRRLETL